LIPTEYDQRSTHPPTYNNFLTYSLLCIFSSKNPLIHSNFFYFTSTVSMWSIDGMTMYVHESSSQLNYHFSILKPSCTVYLFCVLFFFFWLYWRILELNNDETNEEGLLNECRYRLAIFKTFISYCFMCSFFNIGISPYIEYYLNAYCCVFVDRPVKKRRW